MTNRLLTTAVVVSAVLMSAGTMEAHAQELNAKVTINHSQIQGTDASSSASAIPFSTSLEIPRPTDTRDRYAYN